MQPLAVLPDCGIWAQAWPTPGPARSAAVVKLLGHVVLYPRNLILLTGRSTVPSYGRPGPGTPLLNGAASAVNGVASVQHTPMEEDADPPFEAASPAPPPPPLPLPGSTGLAALFPAPPSYAPLQLKVHCTTRSYLFTLHKFSNSFIILAPLTPVSANAAHFSPAIWASCSSTSPSGLYGMHVCVSHRLPSSLLPLMVFFC